MSTRAQIITAAARYITVAGTILPAAYVLPIVLSKIAGFFGRLDLLAWMSDLALLLSPVWMVAATALIILRGRDLPQRFWITFCVNGILAYLAWPIYRMHFGIYP